MLTAFAMYAVLGAFVGILSGLLGIGGGLVIVPVLVIAFGYQGLPPELIMHMAVGTSLASIIFTSISSSLAHHKYGGVKWKIVKYISPGIISGTLFGAYVASKISSQDLQLFFAFFLFYVAWRTVARQNPKPSRTIPGFMGMSVLGVSLGLLSSLMGIGGGILSVPLMIWHNIELRKAIGTSAAIGIVIAMSGTLGYVVNGFEVANLPPYSAGFVYLPAVGGIVLLSMLTAPYGVHLTRIWPQPLIKKILALLLLVIGVRMLIEAAPKIFF